VAALALGASLVPTTFAGHRFWEEGDPKQRAAQKIHFLKNVGLLGGLLLAALDTEGQPSLRWRAGRAAGHARATTASVVESSRAALPVP
jgi:putative oxidoreductase